MSESSDATLNSSRRNSDAGPLNHIFSSTENENHSVAVDHCHIARIEPPCVLVVIKRVLGVATEIMFDDARA
jgi:hypothetical protein